MTINNQEVQLILPWTSSAQGGVSGVVNSIREHWSDTNTTRPALVIDDWDSVAPNSRNGEVFFRYSTIDPSTTFALLSSLLKLPFSLCRIHFFLRERNVATVNFHYPGLAPFGIALLKFLGLYKGRIVLSFHGTDVQESENVAERLVRKFIFRYTDSTVACSNSLANRIAGTFLIDRASIDVIYNGVDTTIFHPDANMPASFTVQLPKHYVVNIASYISRKAQTDLLVAFATVVADAPDLHLYFAGAEGPMLETIRDLSKKLNVEKRVFFLVGLQQREVAYLLSNASVCVQPSLAESFSLAILEAAATGVPIAASNIPGHDEVIFNGKTGSLFKASDPADCSRVIKEVLADAESAKTLARNSLDRIEKELSWQACITAYRALYLA